MLLHSHSFLLKLILIFKKIKNIYTINYTIYLRQYGVFMIWNPTNINNMIIIFLGIEWDLFIS